MDFMVDINIKKLSRPIIYTDKIMLVGSCFTAHIGNALEELKFDVMQNPNGILFDPASVCCSLTSYIDNKQYDEDNLFQLNETWNSWQHHSVFSHTSKSEALKKINESQKKAHDFLKEADWLIITLGSSFSYRLKNRQPDPHELCPVCRDNAAVANCHRAPAQWFDKHLMEIEETVSLMDNTYHRLRFFNPRLKIIYTISPVRHIRDGVVENNRSKARLLEAVHHMIDKFDNLYYFPAYELVIDVLRDYRFYDVDLVHPNYPATEFVLKKFIDYGISDDAQPLMQELKKIAIARKHRPFQPDTNAHREFMQAQLEKTKLLQSQYPFLDLQEEVNYFSPS